MLMTDAAIAVMETAGKIMETWADGLFMAVLFVANMVQTITGFAGNLIAMPFSVHLVGGETAKAVINVFTIAACGWIGWRDRRYLQKAALMRMSAGMLLGLAAGIWLAGMVSLERLLPAYGLMVLLIACKKLFVHRELRLPNRLMAMTLPAAGLIHGLFLSGGALLVIYAVSATKDKQEFRATVAPVWVILGLVLAASHVYSGYYTPRAMMLMAVGAVPLAASVWVGNRLYRKVSQETFLTLTCVLLMVSGITAIM